MSESHFIVRPASKSDVPQIDTLLADDYTAESLAAAIPMMAVTRPVLLANQTYFVAEREGEIVGAGGWIRVVPSQTVVIPQRGNTCV